MIQVIPPPVPPSPQGSSLTQTITNVLPQVQGQAAAPISAKAVTPTSRSERGQKVRGNSEKERGEGETPDKGDRGGSVNISV